MKSVPVMESYNEAAIDVPPELLAASGQRDFDQRSVGTGSNVDGQSSLSPGSDLNSSGNSQLISDWDTDQVSCKGIHLNNTAEIHLKRSFADRKLSRPKVWELCD